MRNLQVGLLAALLVTASLGLIFYKVTQLGLPLLPGQLAPVWTIEAKIEHEGSGFAVTSAKARVGTELKCSADLTFRHIPFPDPSLRVFMDAMANKIGFPMQAMTP